MVLSRRWSAFLIAVGVWTWLIWPRFGLAIWKDDRAFSGGSPTSFLWVHAVLIVASLAIGTTVGVLGVRAWRAAGNPADRRATEGPAAEDLAAVRAGTPKD
ncbi:SCO4848 family membrane protein [Actinoplanes sp. N902-109]|uniref:SCO4848 family membrane protein n=1 Tax=Actinoplanes sp. (strain N902-109) TaxID=649831 RepID=UPI00032947BF|nr:hypothetical protein [Actinoplanes sp. N902-109]AGL21038.1 hypothetical protein L083_7528 [Actinoplanes sp. N902-109]